MYGIEHVLQCVRSVCIVHDSRVALWRLYRVESSAHALQRAHHEEYVLRFLAQHHGSTIYGEQVADVELTDELHSHFSAVDFEIHAAEVTFKDLCLEVSHCACGVCLHRSLRVLHHHHAVLVVGIRYGERCLRQLVEECLLCIAVVLKRLVVVQMVACQVCKQSSSKVQSSDALLCYGVGAALHEGILASGVHHPAEQIVQLDRVRCGVVGRNRLVLDVVAHGRQQSAFVSQLAEHII